MHTVNLPDGSEDEEVSDEDTEWRDNRGLDPLYLSESDEDSDEDLETELEDLSDHPSTSRQETGGKRQTSKETYKWETGQREYNEDNYAFLGDISLTDEIKGLNTPSQIFDYISQLKCLLSLQMNSIVMLMKREKRPIFQNWKCENL